LGEGFRAILEDSELNIRRGILEALEAVEKGPTVLLAPTGYGKTSSLHHLWRKFLQEKWPKAIHVLPLRSLVYDVAVKAVKERGVHPNLVAYQALLDSVEIEVAGRRIRIEKSPYFFSKYNVTTYDSYLTTLYLMPVCEFGKEDCHWDAGFMSISSAITLFDEVHLVLSTEGMGNGLKEEETKILSSIKTTIELLSNSLRRYPLIMTATLPRTLLKWLIKDLKGDVSVHACLGERGVQYYGELKGIIHHGLDPEFSEWNDLYLKSVKTIISRRTLVEDVSRIQADYDKVLVVLNTVKRAIDIYRALSDRADRQVILLHSRLVEKEKEKRLREVEELEKHEKPFILIATQVIEAGVDFDFDALVTEIAPPASIIQRAGRVMRRLSRLGEGFKGLIVINASINSIKSSSLVYPRALVEKSLARLGGLMGKGSFDWRFGEAKPSFIDYLEVYDSLFSSPELNSSYRQFQRALYKLLYRLPLSYSTGGTMLNMLESLFQGSLIRESVLIPLYVPELEDKVPVSLQFVKKRLSILDTENGYIKAVITIDGEKRECKVGVNSLLKRPLMTLSHLFSTWGILEGLVLKKGVYDLEVGLQ